MNINKIINTQVENHKKVFENLYEGIVALQQRAEGVLRNVINENKFLPEKNRELALEYVGRGSEFRENYREQVLKVYERLVLPE